MLVFFLLFLFSSANSDDVGLKYGSEYILDGLNKAVKPCDDSYSFFCGKWLEKLTANNDSDFRFEKGRLTNVTNKILVEAIKAIDVNDKQTPTYKIWLKTFFDQCVNKKIEPVELFAQIFNGIQRVIGPPPVLTKDKSAHDSLVNRNVWNLLGIAQRKLGNAVFFRVSVDNMYTNCDKVQPVLTFNDEHLYMFSDFDLNAADLKDAILNMSVLFAVPVADDDKLKKLIDNIINLNNDLKSFLNTSMNDDDVAKYETITINSTDQLKNVNPNIDWQEFFKGLFSKDQFDYWDQTQVNIQVRNKKYFQQIDDVVKKYDVETVFNYIFYKAMVQQLFTTALAEVMSTGDDHVADCLDWTQSIQWAASAKTYFDYLKIDPMDVNADISIIADNVLSTFKRIVANVPWLSSQEIATIYKGVNSLNFVAPIPDWLSSVEKVEYVTIKYDPDKSLFDNSINLPKRLSVMELDRFINQTPAIETFGFTYPSMSLSWYNHKLQTSFEYSLLPLYSLNYPLAVKYGIIGTKIAQTLLEQFVPGVWELQSPSTLDWLNETKMNKFSDQVTCINDQIISFDCTPNCTARSPNYFWNYTLVQLFREIDGFQIAYQAYKSASQGKTESQVLPNLQDYNSDQLFALAAGRSYCNCYASDDEDIGGHTVKKNRLVKVFRNLPLFRSTFQCIGTGPSSVEKPCGVWGKSAG